MKSSNYLKKIYGNPTDEKYTPGYGVLPIIKYIPEGKIVWCPFDTKHSEFVQKFKDAGFHVVYSHIYNGQDFFNYEPSQWDILVSNPPFSRKVEVFERCLKLGKPFALLMSILIWNYSCSINVFSSEKGKTYRSTAAISAIKYFRNKSYSNR